MFMGSCPLPPLPGLGMPFIFTAPCMALAICLCCMRRCCSMSKEQPEPSAIRRCRDGSSKIFGLVESSSSLVMLSIMHINCLMRSLVCSSAPCPAMALLKPGIIDMTWDMEPILEMLANWSYMMRMVKCPLAIISAISGWSSSGTTSWTRSRNPFQSALPRRRLTNFFASNASNSCMCSPVPTKVMGDLVAATAEMAPPPLAWPSILVMMTCPTWTEDRNAAAWSWAAWPMEESMTKMTRSGATASATARISSNSASLCLCRPDVSTMIRSRRSSLNLSTPCPAMTAGSVSS
mmetsp:Transcript_11955/g.35796  ORF Transcript_11955/g.35796 Transcript_11955/m.35796 type:complete len:292 (+) Transcript_11955:454-1329(+)